VTGSAEDALSTFGLPAAMPRRVAEQVADTLEQLWRAAHYRAPGGLRPDLAAHHHFFNPVAQGKRLREAVLAIEPVALPRDLLSPEMAVDIDGRRWLITPEGRVGLHLVRRALESGRGEARFDADLARMLERDLLGLYREWGRHKLRQVIDYMGGGERPLQLPAMGAALTLLINRSDHPDRAMRRFPPEQREAQRRVDQAFFECADAFATEIAQTTSAPRRRTKEKEGLISGWTLHEVTRRLPDAVVISDAAVYVAPGHQARIVDLIVAELQRRRQKVDLRTLETAFDALADEFHRNASALAGYGLLFERSSHTRQLREQSLARWRESETDESR